MVDCSDQKKAFSKAEQLAAKKDAYKVEKMAIYTAVVWAVRTASLPAELLV